MATTLPALVPCERCNIRYAGYMETESAITALSALAQATRLETFRLLVRHEPEGLAAGDIARSLDVPQNTMSAHLAILARAGLEIGRASCRERVCRTCRSRWSAYH